MMMLIFGVDNDGSDVGGSSCSGSIGGVGGEE